MDEIANSVASASSACVRQIRSSRLVTFNRENPITSVKSRFSLWVVYGGENLDRHLGPLSAFQMSCLRRICGVLQIAHVPNVEILSRCQTSSTESHLRSKMLK